MLKFNKKGGIFMKRIIHFLSLVSVSALTAVIFGIANSSSCYYFHQPEEPKSIEDYKWIK